MMKSAAMLLSLPLASAFLAPAPFAHTARGRSLHMSAKPFDPSNEPAGVKWFPSSPAYWDPLGLAEGQDEEFYYRLSNGEIKNGRVAMLAVVDYIVKGLGFKFPFLLGGVSTEDIPMGFAAIDKVPAAGWIQIFIACFLLDVATDGQNAGGFIPGRVPGNVQPPTPMFKAPGDINIRAKEINNGRLAMMAIFGIWAHEAITGEANPFINMYGNGV